MLTRSLLIALLVSVTFHVAPLAAQGTPVNPDAAAEPDLDALARRLEAAKAAAAKKDQADKAAAQRAAVQRAADKRIAEQRAADDAAAKQVEEQAAAEQRATQERAARAAAALAAAQGTLIVKADAPCKLSLDGVLQGELAAGEARTLHVQSGEQLLECESTEQAGLKATEVKSLVGGGKIVVVFALVNKMAARRQEEAQRVAAEAAARNPQNGGFIDRGGGVLEDTKTGLEWTQSDKGSHIDWAGAHQFCASRGSSWRLPSIEELAALYDASGTVSTPCRRFICKVSPLFHLTTFRFWSGTQNGSSEAWVFGPSDGSRGSHPVSYSADGALCVHRIQPPA